MARTPNSGFPPRRVGHTAAVLLAVLGSACGDSGPPPPRPTSINMFPASANFDAINDTRNFVAAVRDQNGIAMDGQAVTWSSSDPAVVSVDATGRARAEGNGNAVIRATAGDAVGEAAVAVAQAPTTLAKRAGDGQAAAAGTALGTALEVQITDRLGSGIPGRTVTFVPSGGGSVDPATVSSDAQGRATTVWTLGPRAGEPQEVRALVESSGLPGVVFNATGYPGPPAELRPVAGDEQVGLVGTTLPFPLSVQMLDAFENPLPTQVDFQVLSGGGSVAPASVTTGANGVATTSWTLGAAPGEQRMRATAGALVREFTARAATTSGPPATLSVVSGDGQEAPAGSRLGESLVVAVRDEDGIGVQGVAVTFTPSAGTVEPTVSVTSASGLAATAWTLGETVGPQSVSVEAGALAGVVFGADARDPGPTCVLGTPDPSGFDIQVCFVTAVSPAVFAAFENARLRWESLITGDLTDLAPNPEAPENCGGPSAPVMQGPVLDDVVIYATIEEIDGEFNVLGSAGPCYIRDPNSLPDEAFLTTVGRMRFDVADMDRLADGGQLEAVILHEMGHVLGLGTLWSALGFLQNAAPADQQAPGPDTHFNGPLAIAAFDQAGGQLRTAGQKVPVQNVGSSGSINGHWRETVMDRELMTPFLDATNFLSIITVQSMADLGYAVSNDQADSYTVPNVNATVSGLPGAEDGRIPLLDDILWMPLRLVDREGRVVGVLPAGGR